jgi:hypothetical protein
MGYFVNPMTVSFGSSGHAVAGKYSDLLFKGGQYN